MARTALNEVVIVGAGTGGVSVATGLRAAGFTGPVTLVDRDPSAPYERPPLSKGFLTGAVSEAELTPRPRSFYADAGIELSCDTVRELHSDEHAVTTAGGRELHYGQLVWAAGGVPRRLPVAGADLAGVLQLRTLADARQLKAAIAGASRAVVIGGGHIGLEVAAALQHAAVRTTVVELADRLLARVTSPLVSAYYAQLHAANGVEIVTSAAVAAMAGREGRVTGVALRGGAVLAADLVVVGVGLEPSVGVLAEAGARCSDGVEVDGHGRTSLPDVYALGDCANQLNSYAGRQVRLESVPSATEQAGAVVSALLGSAPRPARAPWFWSHQYSTRLQTVGVSAGHDATVVRGDVSAGSFTVVYLAGGRVVALDCVNRPKDFSRGRVLVEQRCSASAAELASLDDLKSLLL